jgi:hypothetical protein
MLQQDTNESLGEYDMSDPEKTSKSDQDAPKHTPELSEDEMKGVVGGAVDVFLNLDGIKGEPEKTESQK